MHALEAERITAGYKGVPVLREVSLHVDAGTVAAIVGPNGAGKSTFLKALVGLLRGSAGKVVVSGVDVSGRPTEEIVRHGLGYVPQVANVFPSMTVYENLEIGCFVQPAAFASGLPKVLDLFPDLRPALRRKAGELSGGQRNMLAVGRALVTSPSVLLLDEPTAGLAPQVAERVWSLIADVAAMGVAVLVVEQNVGMALERSNWVYVLTGGRNRLDGPAAEMDQQMLGDLFLGGVGGGSADTQEG